MMIFCSVCNYFYPRWLRDEGRREMWRIVWGYDEGKREEKEKEETNRSRDPKWWTNEARINKGKIYPSPPFPPFPSINHVAVCCVQAHTMLLEACFQPLRNGHVTTRVSININERIATRNGSHIFISLSWHNIKPCNFPRVCAIHRGCFVVEKRGLCLNFVRERFKNCITKMTIRNFK